MTANGNDKSNLTNHPDGDFDPAFAPVFAVSPASKKVATWGWVKR